MAAPPLGVTVPDAVASPTTCALCCCASSRSKTGITKFGELVLAFGLSRYAFWAYRVATVYYFLLGIVNVVSVQLPGILLVLILLYCVGNGTAKAIFERRTQILSP